MTQTTLPASGCLVVGVDPGHCEAVLRGAARLAERLGARLVCVWVDPTAAVETGPDGAPVLVPVDPDAGGEGDGPEVSARVEREVAAAVGTSVAWDFVRSAGEVAHGLASVARDRDALMIAVGAHKPGLSGWRERLIGGSVAGHLAHLQERPVVILANPGAADDQ
ncbi:hypothetical protein GCM10025865_10210 [Paraoerskovia sediminicola]|uniref:UspA domain-containing protein n=1 Tax=Paraoerskovia sediminicola TaxID=1138587 RepID=A0ABN6X9Z5_9CELL|nr:universal stress protein [Paraoerskovia sediminicola]BDZ41722.1 hypothetical protein GCM10025865_10210 [Paraoerskovia sediminicola]